MPLVSQSRGAISSIALVMALAAIGCGASDVAQVDVTDEQKLQAEMQQVETLERAHFQQETAQQQQQQVQ